MQPPEKIIEACRQSKPDILGLTILQFQSEEILCDIVTTSHPRHGSLLADRSSKPLNRRNWNKKSIRY